MNVPHGFKEGIKNTDHAQGQHNQQNSFGQGQDNWAVRKEKIETKIAEQYGQQTAGPFKKIDCAVGCRPNQKY
jgi:hypothetical protein